jgi:four helix bundle protein
MPDVGFCGQMLAVHLNDHELSKSGNLEIGARTGRGHSQDVADQTAKFEMFEEGTQIRRSMKSVRSNIVEGYGRRRYKQEFLHFLTYAQASCDETIDHLETLFETGSLTDEPLFKGLLKRLNELGRKINVFTQSVEASHRRGPAISLSRIQARASRTPDPASRIPYPGSRIQHPASSIQ